MDETSFVHYLPIATTIVSAAFVVSLIQRASKRNWASHLMWWAIGVFFYGVGTAFESTITLFGNTETLNRLWYWAGALLGAWPLATGSLYLLFQDGKRRVFAHALTIVSGAFVLVASVLVFVGPMKEGILPEHRPMGRGIWEWQWLPWLTPFINLYAVIFLIGGALHSCAKFMFMGGQGKRALGTGLIAFGALLPGIGGTLTKSHDLPEALYIGEITGIIFIWIGYEFCIRGPKITKAEASSSVTAGGTEAAGAS